MSKIEPIGKSFTRVIDVVSENLPEWVAIAHFIYLRDKNDRTKRLDGETQTKFRCDWMCLYDVATIRERVNKELNDLVFVNNNWYD